jgi:hypothetical protein
MSLVACLLPGGGVVLETSRANGDATSHAEHFDTLDGSAKTREPPFRASAPSSWSARHRRHPLWPDGGPGDVHLVMCAAVCHGITTFLGLVAPPDRRGAPNHSTATSSRSVGTMAMREALGGTWTHAVS